MTRIKAWTLATDQAHSGVLHPRFQYVELQLPNASIQTRSRALVSLRIEASPGNASVVALTGYGREHALRLGPGSSGDPFARFHSRFKFGMDEPSGPCLRPSTGPHRGTASSATQMVTGHA
jgi:hypothetical protein